MQQLQRYLGFLQSELLLEDVPFSNVFSFEFVENEHPRKALSLEISDNEVLGKRIERYFEFYLQCSQRYRLIAKNLQIFRNKITIGELDFIIEDLQSKHIVHLELIYKFYLYDPDLNTSTLDCWIGPNRKDRLIEKIKKLQEKQLPLLYSKEARILLEGMSLDAVKMQQRVAYFGHLFIPKHLQNESFLYINKKCIIGYWIYRKDFTASVYGTSLFHIPEKKDWMIQPKFNDCWKEFDQIQKEINQHLEQKKSPLIWIKNNEDSFERFFIVWW